MSEISETSKSSICFQATSMRGLWRCSCGRGRAAAAAAAAAVAAAAAAAAAAEIYVL